MCSKEIIVISVLVLPLSQSLHWVEFNDVHVQSVSWWGSPVEVTKLVTHGCSLILSSRSNRPDFTRAPTLPSISLLILILQQYYSVHLEFWRYCSTESVVLYIGAPNYRDYFGLFSPIRASLMAKKLIETITVLWHRFSIWPKATKSTRISWLQ